MLSSAAPPLLPLDSCSSTPVPHLSPLIVMSCLFPSPAVPHLAPPTAHLLPSAETRRLKRSPLLTVLHRCTYGTRVCSHQRHQSPSSPAGQGLRVVAQEHKQLRCAVAMCQPARKLGPHQGNVDKLRAHAMGLSCRESHYGGACCERSKVMHKSMQLGLAHLYATVHDQGQWPPHSLGNFSYMSPTFPHSSLAPGVALRCPTAAGSTGCSGGSSPLLLLLLLLLRLLLALPRLPHAVMPVHRPLPPPPTPRRRRPTQRRVRRCRPVSSTPP